MISRNSGCLLVSYEFSSNGNTGVLIVGEKDDNKMNIINAFQGEEAMELFNKLTKKEESDVSSKEM